MSSKTSLEDDAHQIREAATSLARRMNHPGVHDLIEKRAGVRLDKVSEVVMSCLIGKADVELRLSDLAKRLGVEPSSVSRKVQKLEEAGLVSRAIDPSDGRACRLCLTADGTAILQALSDTRRELFAETLATWSTEDRTRFTELFRRFAKDIDTYLGESQ